MVGAHLSGLPLNGQLVERGAILRNIANGVRNGRDHLMKLQSSNNGKPQFEAGIDVDDVIATFEYYAELAEGLDALIVANTTISRPPRTR